MSHQEATSIEQSFKFCMDTFYTETKHEKRKKILPFQQFKLIQVYCMELLCKAIMCIVVIHHLFAMFSQLKACL